ncbi:unnamed protein product [Phytomonas sp. Hart1]|nr:unnamed protein product [Phytomonas sp. Hart1]|eukprot:CCW68839.1 unnamed protein product [Phytomonas sp. isolate Hart1]
MRMYFYFHTIFMHPKCHPQFVLVKLSDISYNTSSILSCSVKTSIVFLIKNNKPIVNIVLDI